MDIILAIACTMLGFIAAILAGILFYLFISKDIPEDQVISMLTHRRIDDE